MAGTDAERIADGDPIRDWLDADAEQALVDGFTAAYDEVRGQVVLALMDRQYAAHGAGWARFADEPAHLPPPDDVYRDFWWTDAVDAHVAAEIRAIVTAAELRSTDLFAPDGALASRAIADHVKLIESWSSGQRSEIVDVFDRALTEGWSVPRIAEALADSGALSGAAAVTAARTEAVAAANAGVIAGWRTDPSTMDGFKRWLATADGRTRETHTVAHGQVQPIAGLFEVGAGMADYPGDVNLPVEERVNCRCAVVYLDPDDPDVPPELRHRSTVAAPAASVGDGSAAATATARTMAEPDNGGLTMSKKITAAGEPVSSVDPSATAPKRIGGPVTVEGVRSGDGRVIAANALEWVTPAPMMFLDRTTWGHDDAVLVGKFDTFERVSTSALTPWDSESEVFEITAEGPLMDDEFGQRALRVVQFMEENAGDGAGYGVSVDVDNATCEYVPDPDIDLDAIDPEELYWWGPPTVQVVVKGRVVGATLCPFPAFQEARMRTLSTDGALVASGVVPKGGRLQMWMPCDVAVAEGRLSIRATAPSRSHVDALVASGLSRSSAVTRASQRKGFYQGDPPIEWFRQKRNDQPYPWTVEQSGYCHGYASLWGQRHISFAGEWISPPRATDGYRNACNKQTWVAEGDRVFTTAVFVNGGFHAPTNVPMTGPEVRAWYEQNAIAAADVAVYEDEHGIFVTGAVRPDLDPFSLRELSSSDVSPDWRDDRGGLTMYGLLSVGTSGFVVPAADTNHRLALVASGARAHGGQRARERYVVRDGAVVAAQGLGRPVHGERRVDEIAAQLAVVRAQLAEIIGERKKAELAALLSGR